MTVGKYEVFGKEIFAVVSLAQTGLEEDSNGNKKYLVSSKSFNDIRKYRSRVKNIECALVNLQYNLYAKNEEDALLKSYSQYTFYWNKILQHLKNEDVEIDDPSIECLDQGILGVSKVYMKYSNINELAQSCNVNPDEIYVKNMY